jgi:hypothetical protein
MNAVPPSGSAALRFDVEVDGQTDESWGGVLSSFADASIYQTWAYGSVRWGAGCLSHLVLRRGGRIAAAAQVRIIRMPVLPTGVAYLRWGPLFQPKGAPPDSRVLGKMLECLREEYCRRRGLVLQVIPQVLPESARDTDYAETVARCGFRPHPGLPPYRTIMVDLEPGEEVIRKRLDQKWRNQLNASEKKGLEIQVTADRSAYQEFLRLYEIMRAAKRFDSNVDVGEFGRIQDKLAADEKMTMFLARKDGEVVGALVCSLMGDTAIYLLGATNERARDLKASYFLHWQAMMWLKRHGALHYDLGGIDPAENPGGHHFKSGFGGMDVMQIPGFWASGGMLGDALHHGIRWLRHSRRR